MVFDLLFVNSPFGNTGIDITNHLINNVSYNDISILGTRAMLTKHCDKLALEYCYIENYVLNPLTKVKWVKQLILLGHTGKTTVSEQRTHCTRDKGWEEPHKREFRLSFMAGFGGNISYSYERLINRSRSSSLIIELTEDEWEKLKNWDNWNPYERFLFCIEIGMYRRLEISE